MPSQAFFDKLPLINGDIRQELEKALDQAARETLGKFAAPVATWRRKVRFEVDKLPGVRVVGTNDEIFELVSEKGSRPHLIRPRGARALRFKANYRAKTKRGVLGSSSGGSSGDTVFSKSVNHPGFEPREFVKAIQEQMDVRLEKLADAALEKLFR